MLHFIIVCERAAGIQLLCLSVKCKTEIDKGYSPLVSYLGKPQIWKQEGSQQRVKWMISGVSAKEDLKTSFCLTTGDWLLLSKHKAKFYSNKYRNCEEHAHFFPRVRACVCVCFSTLCVHLINWENQGQLYLLATRIWMCRWQQFFSFSHSALFCCLCHVSIAFLSFLGTVLVQ